MLWPCLRRQGSSDTASDRERVTQPLQLDVGGIDPLDIQQWPHHLEEFNQDHEDDRQIPQNRHPWKGQTRPAPSGRTRSGEIDALLPAEDSINLSLLMVFYLFIQLPHEVGNYPVFLLKPFQVTQDLLTPERGQEGHAPHPRRIVTKIFPIGLKARVVGTDDLARLCNGEIKGLWMLTPAVFGLVDA
jgi:hypothetical protein